MNTHGEVGAYALHKGFVYALCDHDKDQRLLDASAVYA